VWRIGVSKPHMWSFVFESEFYNLDLLKAPKKKILILQ